MSEEIQKTVTKPEKKDRVNAYVEYSIDGGKTWTEPEITYFISFSSGTNRGVHFGIQSERPLRPVRTQFRFMSATEKQIGDTIIDTPLVVPAENNPKGYEVRIRK